MAWPLLEGVKCGQPHCRWHPDHSPRKSLCDRSPSGTEDRQITDMFLISIHKNETKFHSLAKWDYCLDKIQSRKHHAYSKAHLCVALFPRRRAWRAQGRGRDVYGADPTAARPAEPRHPSLMSHELVCKQLPGWPRVSALCKRGDEGTERLRTWPQSHRKRGALIAVHQGMCKGPSPKVSLIELPGGPAQPLTALDLRKPTPRGHKPRPHQRPPGQALDTPSETKAPSGGRGCVPGGYRSCKPLLNEDLGVEQCPGLWVTSAPQVDSTLKGRWPWAASPGLLCHPTQAGSVPRPALHPLTMCSTSPRSSRWLHGAELGPRSLSSGVSESLGKRPACVPVDDTL